MEEIMLNIDCVSKQYKLGQIGGTTLRDELQRRIAKRLGKEDPTKKIGSGDYVSGETFLALDSISFDVKQGERVGIIGHNGAGKSTLLKLISRVTAPSSGRIWLNGRVASMLEVGTGFHPELTGRENIYMNGAILGMTKKEIDSKMEDIIDFSECRQFIDTPVKRYSSGMYVKLAFSVAAHLDAEIMIMDEVLAVGDINFQQKCLAKMKNVALEDGRTILYVSHNMSTIRSLCDRCIVLNKGTLLFDGDVEQGIALYENRMQHELKQEYDVSQFKRDNGTSRRCLLHKIYIDKAVVNMNETIHFKLTIWSKDDLEKEMLRMVICNEAGIPVATTYSDFYQVHKGMNEVGFELDTDHMTFGDYTLDLILCGYENEIHDRQDAVTSVFRIRINENEYYYNYKWNHSSWGYIKLNSLCVTFQRELAE